MLSYLKQLHTFSPVVFIQNQLGIVK